MSRGLGRTGLLILMAAATALIALVEYGGLLPGKGALLVTVVLWTALAQGSVAAVAAADLTGARWVAAVRPELLVAARLLPFLAALFLLLRSRIDLYVWAANPGAWLNRPFFVGRGAVVLLATAVAANLFAARSLRKDPAVKRFAVAYLLLFVASQALVAFDWVMSLSYPWVSSMFGMYFAMETLYAGVATAGLLFLLLDRRRREPVGITWTSARHDAGLLLFGFSVLWGGLFFAQFILLWYGNLPEEVSFIALRIASSPTRELCALFIVACFGVPFLALMPARSKGSAAAVAAVAASVLIGLAAERLVFMLPTLPVRFGPLLVQNLAMLAVWLAAALSAERLLPPASGPPG